MCVTYRLLHTDQPPLHSSSQSTQGPVCVTYRLLHTDQPPLHSSSQSTQGPVCLTYRLLHTDQPPLHSSSFNPQRHSSSQSTQGPVCVTYNQPQYKALLNLHKDRCVFHTINPSTKLFSIYTKTGVCYIQSTPIQSSSQSKQGPVCVTYNQPQYKALLNLNKDQCVLHTINPQYKALLNLNKDQCVLHTINPQYKALLNLNKDQCVLHTTPPPPLPPSTPLLLEPEVITCQPSACGSQ